jgi:hypothetical protein
VERCVRMEGEVDAARADADAAAADAREAREMAEEMSGSRAEATAALKDRYERMRTQYTDRIADLEAQLAAALKSSSSAATSTAAAARTSSAGSSTRSRGSPRGKGASRGDDEDNVDADGNDAPTAAAYARIRELEMELVNSGASFKSRISDLQRQLESAKRGSGGGGSGGRGGRGSSVGRSTDEVQELRERLAEVTRISDTRASALTALEAQFAEYKNTTARLLEEASVERAAAEEDDRSRHARDRLLRQAEEVPSPTNAHALHPPTRIIVNHQRAFISLTNAPSHRICGATLHKRAANVHTVVYSRAQRVLLNQTFLHL